MLEEKEKEITSIRNDFLGKIDTLNKKISEISGGCFWLKTQVRLESGRIIQMSDLQIGDRVLSNIRNGIAEFSDVYLISHIGKLDHEEKFAKVSFTRPDGSKGNLL
jgi:hypothetical protein